MIDFDDGKEKVVVSDKAVTVTIQPLKRNLSSSASDLRAGHVLHSHIPKCRKSHW